METAIVPMRYYDNTRISAYRECPRKFYLRHVRDFVGEGISVDLVFGLGWHEAMNILWPMVANRAAKQSVIVAALGAFKQTWVENGLPAVIQENYQSISENYPTKNPWIAAEMLMNYYEQRRLFIETCSEIEAERPFSVPLFDYNGRTIYLIGRLDKVVKHPSEGRLVIEHKTTGWYAKEGGFRQDYLESFSPNSQVDGYSFAGNSLYDGGIKAVWVDAALTHKTVHDKFKFIPIDRQFAALDAWLTDTKTWVTRMIKEQESHATYTTSAESPLPDFPKNTSSCHLYNGCSFRSVCRYVPNPAVLKVAPPGFRIEHWEPFDVLKLGKIMEKEGT